MNNVNNANYTFSGGQKMVNDFVGRADQAINKAQSWSVLGLSIPKGPFTDKEAIKRLERAQQMAQEIQNEILSVLAVAFKPHNK